MDAYQKAQAAIDSLPFEHEKRAYCVVIRTRRGETIAERYVKASSKRRAELTGLKVNRFVFGNKKGCKAVAIPFGWVPEIKRGDQHCLFENM